MDSHQYLAAAVVAVLVLLVVFYAWKRARGKSEMTPCRVPDNPDNPQRYEYEEYLQARAAGPAIADPVGPAFKADAACRLASARACAARGYAEPMMNTAHWDQTGTYQHTADTWGLPKLTPGDSRVNYSGFSKENMSVGAHWDTDGTYGHTAATLPDFGLSGYFSDVPTSTWA